MIDQDIQEQLQSKLVKLFLEDPEMILAVKQKYLTDELWKIAIEEEPKLFKKVKHPSVELCYFAVSIDGSNLLHILKKVKYVQITVKLLYIAINSCPSIILEIPDKLLDNGLKEIAFDKDPSLIGKYTGYIRPEYIKKKAATDPSILQWVENPDEDTLVNAILCDPSSIVYMKNPPERVVTYMKSHYPNIWELAQNSITSSRTEEKIDQKQKI
jgi:hypothetical protein